MIIILMPKDTNPDNGHHRSTTRGPTGIDAGALSELHLMAL